MNTNAAAGVPGRANCGERPGRVRLVFASGGRRGSVLLCEQCAQGAAPAEPRTKTPALDEFERDLTAEAAAGRIDPVIARDE